MYYVKMVDTALSDWGRAEGKTANLVLECDTYNEAEIVADNARQRTDMINIKIVSTKPTYNPITDQVTFSNKNSGAASWYKPNYFRKRYS
jgi:hypothetical protein